MNKLSSAESTDRKKAEVGRTLQQIRRSEKTDLCFCLDATSSMSSHIAGVKTQITQIVKDVQRTNPATQLRLAIVGYRDALEGDCGNTSFDFTDSLSDFVYNVERISAEGGGDFCEDV